MSTKMFFTGVLAGGVLLLLGVPSTAHTKAHKRVMHHKMRTAKHTVHRAMVVSTARSHRIGTKASPTVPDTYPTVTNTIPTVTPSPGVSNLGTVTHGVGTAGNLGRPTTVGTGAAGEKIRRTVPVPGAGVGSTTPAPK